MLALLLQIAAMVSAVNEWRRRQRRLHVANMHELWAKSRTQRYFQLGQMAAGFAHEIGTPAQTITLAASNLRNLLEKRDLLKDDIATKIKRIEVAISRIASLSNSVKSYRSREFNDRSSLSRNVENAVSITMPMLRIDNVRIAIEGNVDDCVGVSDDEAQTIVINLIENARKAIVEAKRDVRKITVRLSSLEGTAHVAISDTGCGIPEEFIDRVFEPEFSPRGDGSGLGLFIVKQIVERAGGRIALENTRTGACANVWLRCLD